jgi:hypothetical protein
VIIESLARALPWEKTLWPPATPPTDDSYYERIERWAERVLGVSWKSPRPPFMYVIPRPGKGGRLPE